MHPSAAAYEEVQQSAQFAELRSRFRNFAFPMTVAFLAWYFLYVLLSTYAVDFMAKPMFGYVTVGIMLGFAQFASTFLLTWLYIRQANKLDPIAKTLRDKLEGATS